MSFRDCVQMASEMCPGKEIPLDFRHPAPVPALTQQGWPLAPHSLALPGHESCWSRPTAQPWPVPAVREVPSAKCGAALRLPQPCSRLEWWILIAGPCPAAPGVPPWLWYPALRELPCHTGALQNIQSGNITPPFLFQTEKRAGEMPVSSSSCWQCGTLALPPVPEVLQRPVAETALPRLWASMVPTAGRPSTPRGIPTALLPPCWPVC